MSWEKEFVEKGADIEHERWARWQKYMFSKGVVGPDGVFHLPEEFVDRWFRQIDTPYSELSESEKESDRKETRNYLPLVKQALESQMSELRKEVEGMRQSDMTDICDCGREVEFSGSGYNQALDEVLLLLKK